LNNNLACFGIECKIAIPLVIQVKPGVFYEYVQRPCVQLAFSQDHKKVVDMYNRGHMCAHPKMPVAITACCGSTPPLQATKATPNSKYAGEKVTFDINTQRCAEIGGSSCDFGNMINCGQYCPGGFSTSYVHDNIFLLDRSALSYEN
jgi:hypothetical protein